MFLLPDLDRDLQEHPELPVPPVSVDQGYVHNNNNNNNNETNNSFYTLFFLQEYVL